MDKVNMSVAILPMAADFSWDSSEQGLIQSSIFWGYAATQVIGGLLSTRYGALAWGIQNSEVSEVFVHFGLQRLSPGQETCTDRHTHTHIHLQCRSFKNPIYPNHATDDAPQVERGCSFSLWLSGPLPQCWLHWLPNFRQRRGFLVGGVPLPFFSDTSWKKSNTVLLATTKAMRKPSLQTTLSKNDMHSLGRVRKPGSFWSLIFSSSVLKRSLKLSKPKTHRPAGACASVHPPGGLRSLSGARGHRWRPGACGGASDGGHLGPRGGAEPGGEHLGRWEDGWLHLGVAAGASGDWQPWLAGLGSWMILLLMVGGLSFCWKSAFFNLLSLAVDVLLLWHPWSPLGSAVVCERRGQARQRGSGWRGDPMVADPPNSTALGGGGRSFLPWLWWLCLAHLDTDLFE